MVMFKLINKLNLVKGANKNKKKCIFIINKNKEIVRLRNVQALSEITLVQSNKSIILY